MSPSLTPSRKLIVDVGMHSGQDTAFYLKKGFNVVAIEANPTLAEAARQRFAGAIAANRLCILNCGVADHAGELDFIVNHSDDAWSSFVHEVGARGGAFDIRPVPVDTLDALLSPFPTPHYVKIDIEGHDQHALDGIGRMAEKPRYVSVENGFLPMLDRLKRFGYTGFKWINQATVPDQRVPLLPREGGPCLHRFEFGASGLFGRETPGDWLSADAVATLISEYWDHPQLDAQTHGWFDLHARLDD